MSLDQNDASTDLIRWTFTIDPAHRQAIKAHLDDLGADVWVRDGDKFQVTWEEPEGEMDEVIEALWSIHGRPFEVTQESFYRLALHLLQPNDDQPALDAA